MVVKSLVNIKDLQNKWHTIPVPGIGRFSTKDLLKMPDNVLKEMWITSTNYMNDTYWYRQAYDESFWFGKQVIDVGCGFCADSLAFSQQGAKVIFSDIITENIELAKRLCNACNPEIDAQFLLIESAESFKELPELDVVLALGSLHHAPKEIVQPEMHELCRHLKIGGRWLQLAYPYDRWIACGAPPFEDFGVMTDGKGTPWAEWYDATKLLDILDPFNFDVIMEEGFAEYHTYNQFIWFDLERI